MVWIISVLVLIGIVVGVGIAAVKSHRSNPQDLVRIAQEHHRALAPCLNGQRGYGSARIPPGDERMIFCVSSSGLVPPQNEIEISSLSDVVMGSAIVLIVIGLILGASLAGADWQTGTIGTILTWEPRRVRLLLVRALVVAVSVFVLALVLQAVLSLVFAGAAFLRGTTDGAGEGFVRSVAGVVTRVSAAAAVTSLIGVAVSTIGRATAASLGVVFIYLALVESLLHGLVPRIARWLLTTNTVAFVSGRALDVSESSSRSVVITPTHATMVMCAYAVVLMVGALVVFRRRDVN